jgi:hypothetical protein
MIENQEAGTIFQSAQNESPTPPGTPSRPDFRQLPEQRIRTFRPTLIENQQAQFDPATHMTLEKRQKHGACQHGYPAGNTAKIHGAQLDLRFLTTQSSQARFLLTL